MPTVKKYKVKTKKKAQIGIDADQPQLVPGTDPNYNWMNFFEQDVPVNPNQRTNIPIERQSTLRAPRTPLPGVEGPMEQPSRTFTFQRGTGRFNENPYVKAFNTAAVGITGIANMIQNNKLKNKEQERVIKSLEPHYWENMEGEGLNNIPMYTKYGGKTKKQYGGVVDFFEKSGLRSDKKFRASVYADIFGTKEKYTGSAAQNIKFLKELEKGALSAPDYIEEPIQTSSRSVGSKVGEKMGLVLSELSNRKVAANTKNKSAKTKRGDIESGVIVDKRSGKAYVIDDFSVVKSFNVLTGQNVEGNTHRNVSIANSTFKDKTTPTGTYKMQGPGVDVIQSDMQTYEGNIQKLLPIPAFGMPAPEDETGGAIAIHQTYDPANRNKLYGTNSPYASYGCINCEKPNAKYIMNKFPKGDTLQVVDSKKNPNFLKNYKKKAGGGCDDCDHDHKNSRKMRSIMFQAGGDIPIVEGLPEDMEQFANVEAEAGEIIESQNGQMAKVSDTANTHEQGGESFANVSRVLEDTSTSRKDKNSKLLQIKPEDAEQMLGIKIKRPVSHAKAFELGVEKLEKKQKKYDKADENANLVDEITKTGMHTLELNAMFESMMPTTEDVFNLLFDHQEAVKESHDIKDDGSNAKHGGKFNVRGSRVATHKAQTGTNRRPKKEGAWYNPEDGLWYTTPRNQPAQQTVPGSNYREARRRQFEQQQQQEQPAQQTVPENGISIYSGGRTSAGRTTPTGNSNAFAFPGGLDAYKKAWSPLLNLDQYKTVAEAQSATYDYLVQNQPDVAASIWESQGLTAKGRKLMQSDPNFAKVAKQVFDASGKLKPGVKLTPEQLTALNPAYSDNMLGVRAITPSQLTNTEEEIQIPGEEYPVTKPVQAAQPVPGVKRDSSVTINPQFRQQPENDFYEPTYWSDIASPFISLADSMARGPELYNPVEFNQLRLKLMDPTAALNANQSDFNAALDNTDSSGVGAANRANLIGQKYRVNNQVMSQYDTSNVGIKNQEIQYNTNVRDRQSLADAKSREEYFRNVQLSRENQRLQRLKSIEDLSRVDQMKRRQNRSGNLVMKLSPAFDQYGEYNGYQYQPYLPPELGFTGTMMEPSPVANTAPARKRNSKTTTTTTFRTADGRVIRKVDSE